MADKKDSPEETAARPPAGAKVGEIVVDGSVVDRIEHDGRGSYRIENGDFVRDAAR